MAINGDIDIQQLTTYTSRNTAYVSLQREIENLLDRAGIYYRVFARSKAPASIKAKLDRKGAQYKVNNKKMQDLIGVRIVLYFSDDINICKDLINGKFVIDDENSEIDKLKVDTFEPARFNLICKMPDGVADMYQSKLWEEYPIDKTFEVQIRTIFSEGWYEVEHDVRYKHKSDWRSPQYDEYSRFLSSILATLEMCDSSMIHLMDKMAYNAYRNSSVEEMLRYKFRIRFEGGLKGDLKKLLSENKDLLKKVFRSSRDDLIQALSSKSLEMLPNTMDNIIYICNLIDMKDEAISAITPNAVIEHAKDLQKEA